MKMTALALMPLFLVPCSLAAEPVITPISLKIDRPDSADVYAIPGVSITLDLVAPGQKILGIGENSAITSLTDDTGTDILADGAVRETQKLAELQDAFGSGVSMSESGTRGHIDQNLAVTTRNPERHSIHIPVVTMGLPASNASRLQLKGQVELLVAGEKTQKVRVSGIDLDENWPVYFDIEGQSASCSRDSYTSLDGKESSEFYCYADGLSIASVEVVGQTATISPGPDSRANLLVEGAITGLTLDVILPEAKSLIIPLDVTFGLGL